MTCGTLCCVRARYPVYKLRRRNTLENMKTRSIINDRRGGIEGLPLQLMIIILVATMGTAIIVGWMGDIETPKSIGEVEVPGALVESDGGVIEGFKVYVRDQDGNFLEDAVVIFQDNYVWMEDENGDRVQAQATTDQDGCATFGTLHVSPPGGSGNAILEILAYKSGYGERTADFMVSL